KNKLKGRYFIFSITLKLSKIPKRNVTYKVLQDYLENLSAQAGNKIETKSLKDISDAVANIRRSKLPDPKIIGNAGSFFKNVFTTKEKVQSLLEEFTDMPYFEEDHFMKIPSGWLIEQCGWKGKSVGNVGVHDKQALVLVNHGGASGEEIKNLAEQIIKSVYEKFGLKLIPEVNLI
ncbi:MAG: UDP-N-acetylenolpyruvoylglucosamine reductase, partial [Patescibacteria group bacterium]